MSVNLNTNHSNSGVYTSNNINSTNTNENNENSLEFDEVLEQSQNINDDIQISKEALELLNSSNLAKDNFQKIQKALENITDYNTGEKIDFNSLSEAQQRDLVDFISDELYMMQNYSQDDFEIANIQIQKDENFVFAIASFTNDKGELVSPSYEKAKDLIDGLPESTQEYFKQQKFSRSGPLGDEAFNKSIEELARDYVKGNTNNYFDYLKRHKEKIELEGLSSLDYSLVEQMARQNVEINENEENNSDENETILLPHQISQEYVEYKETIKNLIDIFLNNINQNISNSNPTYAQINEIKNSSLKQEDTMLKQALNLN